MAEETFYDSTEQIISMLVEGELTLGGARSAILQPWKLTPDEREGFRERIKKAVNAGSATSAAIDALTDPWVWSFLLLSPFGEGAAAFSWFRTAKAVSPFINKPNGMLAKLGATSVTQLLRGTTVPTAVFEATEAFQERLLKPHNNQMQDALLTVARQNGLDERRLIDWQAYAPGTREAMVARKISTTLELALDKAGDDITELRQVYVTRKQAAAATKKGKTRTPGAGLKAVVREAYVDKVALDNAVRDLGLGDLVRASREMLTKELDEVVPTREAFFNILRGQNGMKDVVQLRKGRVAKDAFATRIMRTFEQTKAKSGEAAALSYLDSIYADYRKMITNNNAHYFPRMSAEYYKDGRVLPGDEIGEFNPLAVNRPARSLRTRTKAQRAFTPDDWGYLDTEFGLTPTGQKEARVAAIRLAGSAGQSVRFERMNSFRALGRYAHQMRSTYALFTKPIGDEIRSVNEITRQVVDPTTGTLSDAIAPTAKYYGGGWVGKSLRQLETAGETPIKGGYFSVADVISGEYGALVDPYAKKAIRGVVMPHMLGTAPTQQTLTEAAVTLSRKITGAFLSTPVGPAIAEAGPVGRKVHEALKGFSEFADDRQVARRLTFGASNLLYSSTLGFPNVGAAMVNLTQPFQLATSWLGFKPVIQGYVETFKDLGEYARLRIADGRVRISPSEREVYIKKAFRNADTMGITGDVFESLERMAFSGEAAQRARPSLARTFLVDLPMKLFEKAEWMNRSVVAHAVDARVGAERAAVTPALRDSFKRQMIQETQFGGHWANTPVLFLDQKQPIGPLGNLLTNPLIRMFLQFQVRTVTSALDTGARIGGREGLASLSGLGGVLRDTSRALGVSALGYYMGRELIGADLSRWGYWASLTDIVPYMNAGTLDPEREPALPVPPIASIISDLYVGATTEEVDMARAVLPRIVPGGIGFQKILNNSPEAPDLPDLFSIQQRYVDWNSPVQDAEGNTTVPVYKSDGTLVAYEPVTLLVARSLGVDFGGGSATSKAERALLAGREQAAALKRRAVDAIVQGNAAKQKAAEVEFQKRFGVPMTISKRQLDEANNRANTVTAERILDMLPPEIREQYARMMRDQLPQRNPENTTFTTSVPVSAGP